MEADSTAEWCVHPTRTTWLQRRPLRVAYKIATPEVLPRVSDTPRAERVAVLLEELLGEPFEDRALALPPEREERFLREDPVVRRLILALKLDPDAERSVEMFLDRLFKELRKGELFVYSEAVMAILVALRHSGVDWFSKIADVFSSSNVAEIARIRRLARRLTR